MQHFTPLFPGLKDKRPFIISGPCSAESEEQTLATARELADIGIKIFRGGIWKPRTKPGGFEGVGAIGLEWLAKVRRDTGMLTATEVATASHVEMAVNSGVNVVWIGARTTANPFAVQEIADALRSLGVDVPVLVKNPLNPDLDLWIGALERLYKAGIRRLGAIHRGFSAYDTHIYRNLPQWHIPIELRRRLPQLPIICDPSHIAGKRQLIEPLCQEAIDLDFNGLIIETHCCPDSALSDSAQQLTPAQLKNILEKLSYHEHKSSTEQLTELRREIDSIDNELLDILARRMAVSREIGEYKKKNDMPVFQVDRHDNIVKSRVKAASEMEMSEQFVRRLMSIVHEESVRQQLRIIRSR